MKTHYQALVGRLLSQSEIQVDSKILQDIDDIYFYERKRIIGEVLIYRFVNLLFSLVFISIWIFIRGYVIEKWFFLIMLFSFMILNSILFVAGVIKRFSLRKLK